MQVLLEKGARVNALDCDKQTPLHWAVYYNNNADVVKNLLKKGANVNAVEGNLWAPIHYAA